MNKLCRKGDHSPPLEAFGKDKSTKDGLTTCCKFCRAAMLQNWKLNNPRAAKRADKNWVAKNLEKVRARAKVASAALRASMPKGEYAVIQKAWREANPEATPRYSRKLMLKTGRDVLNQRAREDRKRYPARSAAYGTAKRARKLQRYVAWADPVAIAKVYDEAARLTKATGVLHHVDHEIPLQGQLVSGLHVHQNLRPMVAVDNMRKGNRFSIEQHG